MKRKGLAKKEKGTKKNRPSVSTMILVGILVVGVVFLAYPTVSDWWNSMHATRAIASYVEMVENTSEQEKQEMLEAAYAYNEELARRDEGFLLDEGELAEYNALLDVSGTGIMGYIRIPAIDVNLPIYHGTDEAILQIASGHIAGSSLPVGGVSTHSVLTGHRGLPSARLFTDLDQLKEGDTFSITVLDHVATYQIDQIRIVLPGELDDLDIEEGMDYCTLITCTPYGINTHRLLLRGHRIENAKGDLMVVREAVQYPIPVVMLAVGIPMLVFLLIGMLLYYRLRKPKKSPEEIFREWKQNR